MLNSPTNARFQAMSGQTMHSPISRPDSVGSVHSATSDSASSSISAGRGPKRGQDICVSEELKIAIDLAFERFQNASPDEFTELAFPSSLTSTERAYIHRLAAAYNYKSKSKGKNSTRYITVVRQQAGGGGASATLEVTMNAHQQMVALLQRCPLTSKERHDLTPKTEKTQASQDMVELNKMTTGKLNNGLPQIPPRRGQPYTQLANLPIENHKHEIVNTISHNQVTLISGETGCGKTTQVPQMILDYCAESRAPCRIICTQPRRIAALSVAERVAGERGENVGQIVGYQIRLESRVSPKTLLTYCTNGVLLRTLIGGDGALATVTHIIVDEIHERDKLCDFLLIVLRQALVTHRNLKVVLMSATLNTELFLRYFNHCPIIQVPGSLYEVEEFYLEDVLKQTGYMTKKMRTCKNQLEKVARNEGRLPLVIEADEDTEHGIMHRMDDELSTPPTTGANVEVDNTETDEVEKLEPAIAHELDKLITEVWMNGDEDLFSQIYHYILSENASADYQHSETGVTPLMAACSRGMTNAAEQLINLGANVHFRAIQAGCTALDIALRFHHDDCVDLLQTYISAEDRGDTSEEPPPSKELSPHDAILLEAYHHSFDDEKVDLTLVMALLKHIMSSSDSDGAVLVFLPGYDDIVSLRDTLLADTVNFNKSRAVVYTLHSNLQTSDQKKIFKRPPPGVRKVILSTNIAETSVTIDDVVYVIDSGKVKEKSFDAISNISMLKCNWISRASSTQRAGRAGRCRPGKTYHLFSSSRYKNMAPYQVAEMLRSPLQTDITMGRDNSVITRAEKDRARKIRADRKNEADRRKRAEQTDEQRKMASAKRAERRKRQAEQGELAIQEATREAARVRMRKLRNQSDLPKTPNSKVKYIEKVIEGATPNTSTLLKSRHLSNRRSREADCHIVKATSELIKGDRAARKRLLPGLAQGNKSAISEKLGISKLNFYYKSKKGSNPRITKETLEEVKRFYFSELVTTTYPNKTKSGKVLRVLKYTQRKTYKLFKEHQPNHNVSLATFNRLRPNEIKVMKHAKWFQCLCDICDNIAHLTGAIKKSMQRWNPGSAIPDILTDDLLLAKATVCDISSPSCLDRKCDKCSADSIKPAFQEWISDSDNIRITYSTWARVSEPYKDRVIKKMKKIQVSQHRWELVHELVKQLEKFPNHKYNAVSQLNSFKRCKESLKINECAVIMDFAENYVCKQAEEAQNAFYSRNSCTIHPMVIIFSSLSAVKRDSVVMLSPDLKHDAAAVKLFIEYLNKHIKALYPQIDHIIFWSDGCTSQYKSRIPFNHIAHCFGMTQRVTWNFYGSRHGKGEADGESAVVKNFLDRSIKAEGLAIQDASAAFHLLKHSDRNITDTPSRRHFYLVSYEEITAIRNKPVPALKIPAVRKIHQAVGSPEGKLIYRRASCYCSATDMCRHVLMEKEFQYPADVSPQVIAVVNALVDEEEIEDTQIDMSDADTDDEDDTDSESDESMMIDGIDDVVSPSKRTLRSQPEPSTSQASGSPESEDNSLPVSEVIRRNPDLFCTVDDDDIDPDVFDAWELFDEPWNELCLQTKLLSGIGMSIADFLSLAPEPPSFLIAKNAVNLLQQMDALDSFEDLTEMGHHLIDIPIEPRLGKMIIYSVILKCLDPVLTITCTLAYKEPFVLPAIASMKREALSVRHKFSADSLSDHMAYLRVFQAWQRARAEGHDKHFCHKNFVSSATMEMIHGMRSIVLGQLRASGFVRARGSGDIRDLNTNSENWSVVKAALCAGTYPNILKVDRAKSEIRTQKDSKVRFHQSSVLSYSASEKITANTNKASIDALPTDWVLYDELSRAAHSLKSYNAFAYVRCATVISPITAALFAGPSRLVLESESSSKSIPGNIDACMYSSDSEQEDPNGSGSHKSNLSIDNWIRFKLESHNADLVIHLRQKWQSLVLRRLTHPTKPLTQNDEHVIRAVISVLTSEEQASGLKQPSGIGQRPRPMNTMDSSSYNEGVRGGAGVAGQPQSDGSSSDSSQSARQGRSSAASRQHHRGGGATNIKSHQQPQQQWSNKKQRAKPRHQGGGADNNSDSSSVRSSASSSRRSSTANSPSNSPGPSNIVPVQRPPQQQRSVRSCRYFVMTCRNSRMLDVSQAKGIWGTNIHTAARLYAALQESQAVFVIFTVQGSGGFHGVASVSREASPHMVAEFGIPDLTHVYFVTWIRRANISFPMTEGLNNSWAHGQPVSQSQDGQELETGVGERLVSLWNNLPMSPSADNTHITILQK